MKIKPKQYAVGLYEAVKNLPPEKVQIVIRNFVNLLVKNNALRLAPQIMDYFERYALGAEKIFNFKIKTAQPVRDEIILQIKKRLPDLLDQEMKKINIRTEVDSTLIGGFSLEGDDLVIDYSVKNKFKLLKDNLF